MLTTAPRLGCLGINGLARREDLALELGDLGARRLVHRRVLLEQPRVLIAQLTQCRLRGHELRVEITMGR